jgi:acetyltransferase
MTRPRPSASRAKSDPVALKIQSPDIAHKSDVGGVVLNASTSAEVERAAHQIIGM